MMSHTLFLVAMTSQIVNFPKVTSQLLTLPLSVTLYVYETVWMIKSVLKIVSNEIFSK